MDIANGKKTEILSQRTPIEIIERYCSKAGRNVVLERYGGHAAEEQTYVCLGSHNCGCKRECDKYKSGSSQIT